MQKQCFKCRESKPISDFYEHPMMKDGHLNKCVTCTKRDVSEREKRLRNNPDWLAKERDRCRKKTARRRKLGLQSGVTNEHRMNWAKKNGHKIKAEKIAHAAFKKGLISKPDACENCGNISKLEKHHPDYSKPLTVQWLCVPCHGITRRK